MNRRGMSTAGVRKWKDFERQVARALKPLCPSARRCLQFQKGHGAPDVKAGPLWVECKARQRVNVASVYEFTAKARKAAHSESIPAVVTRSEHGRKLITLELGDFLKLTEHSPLWKGARIR